MTAGCTIAAKQEWAQARLVAESFREHHPDLPFFALLADEPEGGPSGARVDLAPAAPDAARHS